MSEFKGTKGKWMCTDMVTVWCRVGDNKKTIVNCNNSSLTDIDNYHNSLLISKAPELLEELKFAVKALKAVHSFGATTPIIKRWEKLIKQATEL